MTAAGEVADDRGWAAQAVCLRLDQAAVEAIDALDAAGVRTLLLRGPVIAGWLFGDAPHERTYVDIDLMVSSDDLDRARDVLSALGFGPQGVLRFRPERLAPKHAEAWFLAGDGITIDLHRAVHGLEAARPQVIWEAATRHTSTMTVLGRAVEVPGEAFRALHVVLHAADRLSAPGPRRDLERAVVGLDVVIWQQAVALADELDVVDVMGPVLRTVPGGDDVADALGLGHRWPATLYTAASDERSTVRFAASLIDASWRDRLRLVTRKVFPSSAYLRASSPLARRGPFGLALAYAVRPALLPIKLPGVVRGLVRSRRRARQPR